MTVDPVICLSWIRTIVTGWSVFLNPEPIDKTFI